MSKMKKQAQIGMDETIVENPHLLDALQNREDLKQGVANYRKADREAKEMIRNIDSPLPFRCGGFLISRKESPARDVEFHSDAKVRISIKALASL